MLWVTSSRIRVNRTATTWIIRRFVDPHATLRFAEPAEVADIQRAFQSLEPLYASLSGRS